MAKTITKTVKFPEWKRWTLACAHAFVAGFVLTITPVLSNLTFQDLKTSTVASILLTAVFAGVKLAFEQAALYFGK